MGSSKTDETVLLNALELRKFAGEYVTAGSIIVRQRGSRIKAGTNVGMGKDDTLFAHL